MKNPLSPPSTSLCGAIAIALLPGALNAAAITVVNADFSRDISAQNPGGNPAPVLYASTGPAADTGTVWNDLQVPLAPTGDQGTDSVSHPVQFNNLSSSTGTATTIDIELTSGFFRAFNSGAPLPTDPSALQNDRIFSRLGQVATITVQGLDPGSLYDLYFIGSGSFVTGYTIGSTTEIASGTSYDGSWTEGQEYAVHSGIAPDGFGNIVIAIQDAANPIDGFGVINGLQIVQIPEPSAAILLVGSAAGLAFRRRRD